MEGVIRLPGRRGSHCPRQHGREAPAADDPILWKRGVFLKKKYKKDLHTQKFRVVCATDFVMRSPSANSLLASVQKSFRKGFEGILPDHNCQGFRRGRQVKNAWV